MTSWAEQNNKRPVRRWLVIIVAGLATGILLSLSYWQYSKIAPRDAEIALIRERMTAPPSLLDAAPDEGWLYRRAMVTGAFDKGHMRRVYRAGPDGRPGYHILMPFRRQDAPGIWVDLGWLSSQADDPSAAWVEPGPPGAITGRIHPRQRSPRLIAPAEPDRAANLYYRIQPEVLGQDVPFTLLGDVYLIAESAPDGLTATDPPVKLEHNHQSYAVQWLAMAVGLVAITALFLRRG
ncbi:MAG: SURF1 family protein [Sphingomonadales bacterium]